MVKDVNVWLNRGFKLIIPHAFSLTHYEFGNLQLKIFACIKCQIGTHAGDKHTPQDIYDYNQ